MADPLGGPVGIPLVGPVTSYARPTDPLAPIRDMMARMALVAAPGPGPRKADAGPDPMVPKPELGPLVPPGVPVVMAAAQGFAQGHQANFSIGADGTIASQGFASGQQVSFNLPTSDTSVSQQFNTGAASFSRGGGLLIGRRLTWIEDLQQLSQATLIQTGSSGGGQYDTGDSIALPEDSNPPERPKSTGDPQKDYEEYQKRGEERRRREEKLAEEVRRSRIQERHDYEAWVAEGNSRHDCDGSIGAGIARTSAYYPVIMEYDEVRKVLGDIVESSDEAKKREVSEKLGRWLQEVAVGPKSLLSGLANALVFGTSPKMLAIQAALRMIAAYIGLGMELDPREEKLERAFDEWLELKTILLETLYADICHNESRPAADEMCKKYWCWGKRCRSYKGDCEMWVPPGLERLRDPRKAWPAMETFVRDDGLVGAPPSGAKLPDGWPPFFCIGWARYYFYVWATCKCAPV